MSVLKNKGLKPFGGEKVFSSDSHTYNDSVANDEATPPSKDDPTPINTWSDKQALFEVKVRKNIFKVISKNIDIVSFIFFFVVWLGITLWYFIKVST